MSEWTTTTLKKSVHMKNESPIYGENATHVEVLDEAAGPFIQLSRETGSGESRVRMDWPEDFDNVVAAVREIMSDFPAEEFGGEDDNAGD